MLPKTGIPSCNSWYDKLLLGSLGIYTFDRSSLRGKSPLLSLPRFNNKGGYESWFGLKSPISSESRLSRVLTYYTEDSGVTASPNGGVGLFIFASII